jgi:hypothetical protein
LLLLTCETIAIESVEKGDRKAIHMLTFGVFYAEDSGAVGAAAAAAAALAYRAAVGTEVCMQLDACVSHRSLPTLTISAPSWTDHACGCTCVHIRTWVCTRTACARVRWRYMLPISSTGDGVPVGDQALPLLLFAFANGIQIWDLSTTQAGATTPSFYPQFPRLFKLCAR